VLASSSIPTLGWDDALLRLAVAALLGGAIGVERELREREAGLRTHLLVSVGSALFTIVSAYGFHAFLSSGANVVRADPSRIAAQIVTGIGFLGAGAIIRQGLSVRGLTTAASLWVVAAIGLAAGAGYYSGAVIATAIVLVSLWPLRLIAYRVLHRFRPETERLIVQMPSGQSPGVLIETVEQLGVRLDAVEISQEGDRRNVGLDVALPKQTPAPEVVAKLADVEGVLDVRWME
jgi:putative Mg2+ transporter-C (MgtC) family protein